jgi:hypothetical protein
MFIAASGIPDSEARGEMIKKVLEFLPASNQVSLTNRYILTSVAYSKTFITFPFYYIGK